MARTKALCGAPLLFQHHLQLADQRAHSVRTQAVQVQVLGHLLQRQDQRDGKDIRVLAGSWVTE